MAKKQPISQKQLNRILLAIIIFLAFLAGYYHSAFKLERKKYLRLEDKYVRVRQMLGVDEMQNLIDNSYQQ